MAHRIFMARKNWWELDAFKHFSRIPNLQTFDINFLEVYENPPEPPSQQLKQTVDGEQVDDGRVEAGKLILPVDESPPDKC